jgi:hypothetical protein
MAERTAAKVLWLFGSSRQWGDIPMGTPGVNVRYGRGYGSCTTKWTNCMPDRPSCAENAGSVNGAGHGCSVHRRTWPCSAALERDAIVEEHAGVQRASQGAMLHFDRERGLVTKAIFAGVRGVVLRVIAAARNRLGSAEQIGDLGDGQRSHTGVCVGFGEISRSQRAHGDVSAALGICPSADRCAMGASSRRPSGIGFGSTTSRTGGRMKSERSAHHSGCQSGRQTQGLAWCFQSSEQLGKPRQWASPWRPSGCASSAPAARPPCSHADTSAGRSWRTARRILSGYRRVLRSGPHPSF